jgi:hypothetical protein
MFFNETEHGSCILDVDDNRLELTNVRMDGVASDRFALVKGTTALVVGAPQGGDNIEAASVVPIRWATVGTVERVHVEVSFNDGGEWTRVGDNLPNTGELMWSVPAETLTEHAVVRVSSTTAPGLWIPATACSAFTPLQHGWSSRLTPPGPTPPTARSQRGIGPPRTLISPRFPADQVNWVTAMGTRTPCCHPHRFGPATTSGTPFSFLKFPRTPRWM